MQLNEAGINARKYLLKYLGFSQKQLDKRMRAGKVSAEDAIGAITKGIRAEFGGLAKEQARTFNGQLSTLKDNANYTLGKVMLPLFNELRDDVFPDLNKATENLSETFSRTDLTFSDKLKVARDQVKRDLGPLGRDIETAVRNAHLDDKLASFVEAAAPKIAEAAARAAPKAAASFVTAFTRMGPWAQLLTVGFLASKLGAFSIAGQMAIDRFATSYRRRAKVRAAGMGTVMAAETAAAFAGSVGPSLNARKGRLRASLRAFGTALGRIAGAAMTVGILYDAEQMLIHAGNNPVGKWYDEGADFRKPIKSIGGVLGKIGRFAPDTLDKLAGLPPDRPPARAVVTIPNLGPLTNGGRIANVFSRPIVTQLVVDGRVLAEVVDRQARHAGNRR